MRITIAAVGRLRAGPEKMLFDTYAKRIAWPIVVREVDAGRGGRAVRLREESAKLRAALPAGAPLIVLDERGEELDSRTLAARLGRWRDDGHGDLAVIIGGADGVPGDVRDAADLLLSFGRLTWPHLLVRPMLAEQLYRAQQILAGHPYHRD